MQSIGENKPEVHPISASEYAKIHAILQRIAGLRRAMAATALLGVAVSSFVFLYAVSYGIIQFLSEPGRIFSQALQYGIISFVPFIAIMGYFSYRVNKHIEKLSKGKYEPPIIIE